MLLKISNKSGPLLHLSLKTYTVHINTNLQRTNRIWLCYSPLQLKHKISSVHRFAIS